MRHILRGGGGNFVLTCGACVLMATPALAQILTDTFTRGDGTNLGVTEMGGFAYTEFSASGGVLSSADVASIDGGRARIHGDILDNPALARLEEVGYDLDVTATVTILADDYNPNRDSGLVSRGVSYGSIPARMTPSTIKAIRERLGLTGKQMAGLLGTGTPHIFDLEAGRKHPSGPMRALLVLLEAFDKEAIRVLEAAGPWRSLRSRSVERAWAARRGAKGTSKQRKKEQES